MGKKEAWEIIDNFIATASYVNLCRCRLVELGFTEEESYDMVKHFVVDNIMQKTEEQ